MCVCALFRIFASTQIMPKNRTHVAQDFVQFVRARFRAQVINSVLLSGGIAITGAMPHNDWTRQQWVRMARLVNPQCRPKCPTRRGGMSKESAKQKWSGEVNDAKPTLEELVRTHGLPQRVCTPHTNEAVMPAIFIINGVIYHGCVLSF